MKERRCGKKDSLDKFRILNGFSKDNKKEGKK
jgi:hypothetical protein